MQPQRRILLAVALLRAAIASGDATYNVAGGHLQTNAFAGGNIGTLGTVWAYTTQSTPAIFGNEILSLAVKPYGSRADQQGHQVLCGTGVGVALLDTHPTTQAGGWATHFAFAASPWDPWKILYGDAAPVRAAVFLGRPGGDYRLRYASPCIDSGMLLPGVTDDIDGRPRPVDGDFDGFPEYDMGAYEYDPRISDSDGDGMPDDWEHENDLDPLDPDDAQLDPDEDFFSNLQEYTADTDPNDGGCYFRIVRFTNAPPWTEVFTSSTARVYSLLGRTNLLTETWQSVPGAGTRRGTGGADALADDNDPPQGPFYRLKVELP